MNMNLMDASVQPLALRLLESVTLSSPTLGQLVKSEVPLDRLLVHLQVYVSGGGAQRKGVAPDAGWPIESSFCPRMNQQLQTKAMALLTALLQGASPVDRKVGVHLVDVHLVDG